MRPELDFYMGQTQRKGDMLADIGSLLTHYNCEKTLTHSLEVAQYARKMAEIWGENESGAEIAGWLHDISAIVPSSKRLALAEELNIDILAEEREYPMILHQKLSMVIARDGFAITNALILKAIECHTTLKSSASPMEKIIFIADKIKWDQPGDPPYLDAMIRALDISLDAAAFYYLDYLWQHRDCLPVIHPWLIEAYSQLKKSRSSQ